MTEALEAGARRPARVRGSAAIVAAAAVVACGHTEPGTAVAEPAPHVFPNLDEFVADQSNAFYRPLRGGPSYVFYSPGGIVCSITLGSMACSGRFSDQPYGLDSTSCSFAQPVDQASANAPHTYEISPLPTCPSGPTSPDQILPAGRKFAVVSSPGTSFTCAVGPAERVACIDQIHNHGFVIEPTGAWTF